MKALAARRRHRLAPVVIVLLALLGAGVTYSVIVPQSASAEVAGPDAIAEGAALFVANCATCHGTNAEGGPSGPSLIGVGAAAVDFQVSSGRMPLSFSGPQAPAKPPQLDREQTAALAAFVASLGPGPAIPTADLVDPTGASAARGMELFRTNCAQCHNAVGAGGALSDGKYAPALTETSPVQIYEAMLTGPQSMPVFNDANISPEEKRDVIAYILAQREPGPGGLDLGGLGPVSEGLWVWVVGIGLLIGSAVWLGAKSS